MSRKYEIEVVFIRHAESVVNAEIVHLCDYLKAWRLHPWGPWPEHDLGQALASVFTTDLNPALSNLGRRQLSDMAMTVKELDFFENSFPFDAVFTSPLQRALQTCQALIPSVNATQVQGTKAVFEVVNELCEANTLEHIYPKLMNKRIQRMENILQHAAMVFYESQASSGVIIGEERKFKVVLVGHCKYFNHWLQQKFYMQNVDFWLANYTFQNIDEIGKWSEACLLLRTPLSYKHPGDYILSYDFLVKGQVPVEGNPHPPRPPTSATDTNATDTAASATTDSTAKTSADAKSRGFQRIPQDEGEDEDESDEPFCRICHVSLLFSPPFFY